MVIREFTFCICCLFWLFADPVHCAMNHQKIRGKCVNYCVLVFNTIFCAKLQPLLIKITPLSNCIVVIFCKHSRKLINDSIQTHSHHEWACKCSLRISSALSLILFANQNVFLLFDAHKQQWIIRQNNHLQTYNKQNQDFCRFG